MPDIRAAIEALEKATEGSEKLDVMICRALHGYAADEPLWHVLPYTRSLDAALTLVPAGWAWFVEQIGKPYSEGRARLWIPSARTQGLQTENINVDCATPALALCLAALRARESAIEPEGE